MPDSPMRAMHNGVWLAPDATLNQSPSLDRVSHYGDGLFETMLCERGNIPLQRYHLQRLRHGLAALRFDADFAVLEAELDTFLQAVAQDNDFQRIKWLLSRHASKPGYSTEGAVLNSLLVASAIAPPDVEPKALRIMECETRLAIQPRLAGLKHCNRLEQVLARMELPAAEFDEGLMLDLEGNVVEAIQGNIFLLQDGYLVTPPVNRAGVAGVMREFLLREVLPGIGLDCRIENVSLAGLQACDAMFVCNAVRGPAAVASVTTRSGQRIKFPGNTAIKAIQEKVRARMCIASDAGGAC
ncbi:MAG: aminodeoxychorismate lyase [Gammaproteobacteria bacterium]|nr:aminodeoxychorismate lyase [Gammaproteobacteria bacterium]NND38741.1 aminodeoxychorismate lyase [Pseudomonadales bacterium]NNL11139.1 aminodeoxychorismate lyase [Pseudomonadales bacterium]NNM12205.1 aminodeoxychorismate lyase [Pseudomonadales bacterium]